MTSGLGVVETTLAKIVSSSVDDNRATNDGVGTGQLKLSVSEVELGVSRFISFDVTQVTDMTVLKKGGKVKKKRKKKK